MLYKDLDLKWLREKCNLDFAHYTFPRGMCSCCHSPMDMPSRYWVNKREASRNSSNYTYILFYNADNGRGSVKGSDKIASKYGDDRVLYRVRSMSQLYEICKELQNQLGSGYKVLRPNRIDVTILIVNLSQERFDWEDLKKDYVF